MLAVRLKATCNLHAVGLRCGLRTHKRQTHNYPAPASEFSDVPEYPPILDTSRDAQKRRKKAEWHTKIANLPTVEQKLMELNMPKYFGFWSCRLNAAKPKLNGLNFTKYATRTHISRELPDSYYDEVKEEASAIASKIQDQVEALIKLNFGTSLVNKKSKRKDNLTQSFLVGLHKIVNASLTPSVDHVKDFVVDLKPRVEAFWFLGGIEPDKMLIKTKKNSSYQEGTEHERIDRPMQGRSNPLIGIRSGFSLPEVVDYSDPLATSGDVPVENMDPRAYGYKFKHKHATITTAFWPFESKEHAQFWIHGREDLERSVSSIGDHYHDDFLQQKMILSSFCQGLAHATYLGFGPVTELTYPIVHQSVLSDGQKWNFGVYQLNTCVLHSENAVENPLNNILWLNDEQLLFEAVDDTGVKGFNPDVLKHFIAMYLKKGIERENASPYLAPYKYVAHHPASEKFRQKFHHFLLQYIMSGRPRCKPRDEVYLWEKIYKVDFKTRPYEPPRRFFEPHYAQKDPGMRRLDDYPKQYIRRKERKEGDMKFEPRLDTEELFKYDK